MASPVPIKIRVDDWTLRCLFNRARIYQGARAKRPKYVVKETLVPRQPTLDFPYPFTALSYYFDKDTNEEVAYTHHFVGDDGSLGASGRLDPKRVYLKGVRYQQIRGSDATLRDPSLRYRYGTLWHWAYVIWRKYIKCYLLYR